jgi:hypothetical protein
VRDGLVALPRLDPGEDAVELRDEGLALRFHAPPIASAASSQRETSVARA